MKQIIGQKLERNEASHRNHFMIDNVYVKYTASRQRNEKIEEQMDLIETTVESVKNYFVESR